jgi:hypothetical protein
VPVIAELNEKTPVKSLTLADNLAHERVQTVSGLKL